MSATPSASFAALLLVLALIPAFCQPPSPCADNSQPTCGNGAQPTGGPPPSCADGSTPTCADGSTPTQPNNNGGGGAPTSSSPHAAAMLGDVGHTTVSGTVPGTSTVLPVGENIYGPFEAGFGEQQENIIRGLGCTTPANAYVNGGIDTKTAEEHMAQGCGITLPRWENGQYVSLLDQCGGHTNEYHFHERLSCLYSNTTGGHSPKVGETSTTPKQPIYGKWEHDTEEQLPLLDACGGHWGRTLDSPNADVYHYHVQDNAPFTIGCYGPNDDDTMVTVQQCRNFYTGCDGVFESVTTPAGSRQYDNWCPCYDATGSNTGTSISELLVFRVVSGSLTLTVANTVDTCQSAFQDSVKKSLAAAASEVSSATYSASDVMDLKVSGCSTRRLSVVADFDGVTADSDAPAASLRRLAQVDISYKIKSADVAAASSLATASSASSQSFTSTFTSTMQTDGITVTSPQLTTGTVAPSSQTTEAPPAGADGAETALVAWSAMAVVLLAASAQ